MSIDTAVAWAKKMADVLGEAVLPSSSEQVSKAPRGGAAPSTNGTPASNGSNGAPAANGAPTAGGTPTAAPSANGTPAANGTPSANGTPPANGQSGTGPASGPAGTSAKACAEAAQKAANDVAALLTQVQTAETEANNFVTDAEVAKTQVDDAKTQAEEADQGIVTPAPLVQAQGEDAKAQYESAIQITGEMQNELNDAEAKESTIRDQAGVTGEGLAQIEVSEKSAKKNAEQAKRLAEQASNAALDAKGAATTAEQAAAASKSKADQAKDDAPDKATLQKAAQEEAQHAAAAKDAAGKAEESSKQASTIASDIESVSQKIEQTKQEAKTNADAVKQLESGVSAKIAPFYALVGDAKAQEADCKAKLSEEDAEAILRKRYEELGGDPELSQALADEDKDFTTITELHRAELKNWQQEKIRELDEYKAQLEGLVKEGEGIIPPTKKWLEGEINISVEIVSQVNALGEKLKTEPGKALMHEFNGNMTQIEEDQTQINFIEKIVEKTKAALDTLAERYKDVDAQYEASEKLISESRTELDNILQMDEMSLEQKIDFLQVRPKPVRDRVKKSLDDELNRVLKLTILEAAAESTVGTFPQEPFPMNPLNWDEIKAKIAKIQETSLEELQQDDPKLADAKAEYEQAGGDAAVLDRRVAAWREEIAETEKRLKEFADEYQARTAKLSQQLQEATLRLRESEANANGFREILAQKQQALKSLQQKAAGKDGTSQDRASIQLLEKEIKRIETNLKNYQNEVSANKSAKANAEKMIELERQRHEQIADDDLPKTAKPTAEDVSQTPFPMKYTELTGKSVPA